MTSSPLQNPRTGPVGRLLPLLLLLGNAGCDLADAAGEAGSSHAGDTKTPAPAGTPTGSKRELPLVRTEPMAVRNVLRQIKDVGHAESLHIVDIISKVSERVEEVLVDEADEVKRGQVLARLDRRFAALQVQELEIQAKEARQTIAEKQLAYDEAKQKLETAKVEAAKKERDYQQKLKISSDIMSPLELDDARTARAKADSDLKVAELAARRAEVLLESVGSAVQRIEVQIERARIDLAERTIKSPIDGVVSARHVAGGESVSTNSGPLFTVVDHHNLVCVLSRTQQDLPYIRKGQSVFLTTDAWPGEEFTGVVDVIRPVIEPDSGSFSLRIRVTDEKHRILPGMFLRARIITGQSIEALTLSKRAVVYEGDRPLAWVIRDGRSYRVYIEPGIEEKDFLEVTNRGERGFRPDDAVVVSGHKDLREGREVEVVAR